MRELSKRELEAKIKVLEAKNIPYWLDRKRDTTVLMYNGREQYICKPSGNAFEDMTYAEKQYILSVINRVKGNVKKYLKENNGKYDAIKQRHHSNFRNNKLWQSMPQDSVFWEVDVKHCFWRIAFLKGYLQEKLYNEVLEKGDQMKVFRNMALSCIVAPKVSRGYYGGKLQKEIIEDSVPYKVIYDNIRFTAYNMMGDLMHEVGPENVMTYRTDGIYCHRHVLARICKRLKSMNMEYRVRKCNKHGSREIKSMDPENHKDVEISRF